MPQTQPLSPNEIRDRALQGAPALRGARVMLNRSADTTCEKQNFGSAMKGVALLFDLYQKYTTLLPVIAGPRRARRRKAG